MSEKEHRPFHAKDVSSGQETADVLAEVLKHAKEREQAAKGSKVERKEQPKWVAVIGANLGILMAMYLLLAQPSWVVMNPIGPPPEEDLIEGLRISMFIDANKIEFFRIDNDNRLPATLAEVGATTEGLIYSPLGDSYRLVASVGDHFVEFDSSLQNLNDWLEVDLSGKIGG